MRSALVFPRFKYPSGDIPIGVLSIATYCKRGSSSQLDVIDTTFSYDKQKFVAMLKKNRYNVVGFSLMTTMLRDAYDLASQVKRVSPKTRVVFGGPHPTVMPLQTLQSPYVDAVAIGEGEYTWLDLVNNNGNFEGMKGIWYKEDGSITKNKPREVIKDLDSLPFPNIDLVDLQNYFRHWFQLDSVSRNLRGINIISSRGCPYNCSFCQPTLAKLFGRRIRKRSPDNVVAELKHWKKKHKIQAFMFQDDTLIFDKQWVSEICDKLIESNLDLIWSCNARANLVDYEIFAKMKKAGLRKVFLGAESGSQRILDEVYNKCITLKQVEDSVKILKSLGLKVQAYFMIGAPTETIDEANQTLKFARSLDIDEATFSITTPLPATYLYEQTKEHISEQIEDFDYYKTPVYTGDIVIPKAKLIKLKQKALLSFYLSPKRFLGTVKGFATPVAIKKSLVKLKRF